LLINKFLKTGYVHFGNSLIDSELTAKSGTPQGSILSPLFCNILLSSLDYAIENKIQKIHVPRSNKINEEYNKSRRYLDTE